MASGKKFTIEHERAKCIGCGVCISVAPEFWDMKEDGKSHLKGSKADKRQVSEKDAEKNKAAAESCPVNVIHITDPEGNRII
jgi:ferredoxin